LQNHVAGRRAAARELFSVRTALYTACAAILVTVPHFGIALASFLAISQNVVNIGLVLVGIGPSSAQGAAAPAQEALASLRERNPSMKRCLLDIVTVGIVLGSAFFLAKAGSMSAAQSAAPRQAELQGTAQAENPYMTRSAVRYRHCQEHHWRACFLQH
jgi:hypothetical protein